MLSAIIIFFEIKLLLPFIGASIYISFFHKKSDSQPIYYGKRKISFNREGIETINSSMKVK